MAPQRMARSDSWISFEEEPHLSRSVWCAAGQGYSNHAQLPERHLLQPAPNQGQQGLVQEKIAGMKNLPAFYIVKDGQVTGTKSLQATAIYLAKFVTALFNQWLAARS